MMARTLACVGVLIASTASAQIHTAHDHIPDFCSGAPIWAGGLPSATTVRVPAGQTFTVTGQMTSPATAICVAGTLRLGRDARLWVGTLVVEGSGVLEIGTATDPGRAEIVIADRRPDDPGQFGTGLIAAGAVRVHGEPVTPWSRLAIEPMPGQNVLTLAAPPIGWKAGDRLVLPDTRHLRQNEVTQWAPAAPQWEAATVASVSGETVFLTAPLKFEHSGARDGEGQVTFMPHVANLTRSVVIRSERASGARGHTLFTARADVDIRYARFADLGRTTIDPLHDTTNHVGRYAVHAHHLVGPRARPGNGYQFTLLGNAIDGGDAARREKWGIAIHDSHYGLIQQNVVYNSAGTAVMFEDGSESYNVIDSNFALRSVGEGGRLSIGTEGGGFWFKGPNNYVRNNVAADVWGNQPEAAYGFKFFLYYLGNIKVPTGPGADTSVAGEYTNVDGNKLPVLEFANNEVYGAAQGLTYWWVNTFGMPNVSTTPTETVFRDTSIWHVYNVGVYHYPSDRVTFDGLTIRGGKPQGTSACCLAGFTGSDYAMRDLVIRRADIQGMSTGIGVPMLAFGPMTIEDSTFRNDRDIVTSAMWNVGGGQNVKPREVTVRRTRHASYGGRNNLAIVRDWNTTARPASAYNLSAADVVRVFGFQGDAADNFQAFYTAQGTQEVAGGRAPCQDTRPEVTGLVCRIAGEVSPRE
jgi:hypothetical protein